MVQFLPSDGLFALVLVFGMVAFGLLLSLGIAYMDHRKEMALIEAGAYDEVSEDTRAWILGGGLLLVAIGLGTLAETLLSGGTIDNGITVALVGVAALVYYVVKRRQSRPDTGAADEDGRSA